MDNLFLVTGILTVVFFGAWFVALYAKILWLMMKNGWNRI